LIAGDRLEYLRFQERRTTGGQTEGFLLCFVSDCAGIRVCAGGGALSRRDKATARKILRAAYAQRAWPAMAASFRVHHVPLTRVVARGGLVRRRDISVLLPRLSGAPAGGGWLADMWRRRAPSSPYAGMTWRERAAASRGAARSATAGTRYHVASIFLLLPALW